MTAKEILKRYFGYDDFREGQAESIADILGGNDVLDIMPTGAGKSICYQVPAMLFNGITIVISPLISLMRDQVSALKEAGINGAYINSSLTSKQIQLVLENANSGMYKIIYVAPERLNSPQFLAFSDHSEISMVTVDEAHCISQWGQDFRPSYSEIPRFIRNLKSRPILSAFTATATEKVKEDIIRILELENPKVLVTGFDRKNLYFEVQHPENKDKALFELIEQYKNESGIIYCTSRKSVECVCDLLSEKGYLATRYHAGLDAEERKKNQDDFIKDEKRIMVATNAFGMGIDKSNVNYVVHYNMPKDIESYYQEAGRAGRDGRDANCVLLFSSKDVMTIKWMIENEENDKIIQSAEEKEVLKRRGYERLNLMTNYCSTTDCLRSFILKYFGENIGEYCGKCSNCNNKELVDVTEICRQILLCVKQLKERFGKSMVTSILRGSRKDDIITRDFDKLSCFNSTKRSANEITFIVTNLVNLGYLNQVGDKYPILNLGNKADEILVCGNSIEMNVPQEIRKENKTDDKTTSRKSKKQVNDEDVGLFNALRTLRAKIAIENKVPAYIIFDDKTLVNMCTIKPKNRVEMMSVSGVGEIKLEKYGSIFIKEIEEYCCVNNSEMNAENEENKGCKNIEPVFVIPQKIIISIQPHNEFTLITHIARKIQDELNSKNIFSKISAAMIGDWLVKKGYLQDQLNEKTKRIIKIPTEFGLSNGISQKLYISRDHSYTANTYSKEFQKYIIDNINEIILNYKS